MSRPSEEDEWIEHRVAAWVETYKKAMLTPVLLDAVAASEPVTIAALAEATMRMTGWNLTERGLYRTISRLEEQGLLSSIDRNAPRTGALRKEIRLTDAGRSVLAGIGEQIVPLPARVPTSAARSVSESV